MERGRRRKERERGGIGDNKRNIEGKSRKGRKARESQESKRKRGEEVGGRKEQQIEMGRINKDEGADKRKAFIAKGDTYYTPFHIACMDEMLRHQL